jgi:uncharacterized protein
MPVEQVLADSGLLIGLFDRRDKHHARCAAFLREFRGRLLTTWQVVTEALAMLDLDAQQRCLTWLQRGQGIGLLRIECTDPADLGGALELTKKYRDQPMDFADASIYLLAVRQGVRKVASVDARDFGVYRLPGNKRFENVLA